ncbi:MAG: 16S rRNA (cytidine(1402)-2'-O)-methyltransferase [Verrucomicrobia bacterium]|nr:16S rRNA (cytidine(1402)-2'-O)-methyltransferase [Verrucomicrobiota bacterium]
MIPDVAHSNTSRPQAEPQDLAPLVPGTLYLVATPIGNLEDITLRAIRTLKECDFIAAEDTRRTGILLNRFGIEKRMISCFQHNERRRGAEILEALKAGARVALVSDAGTPAISDPGERLVRSVLDAGFRVESVPGPCALISALTASGTTCDQFLFAGFLPHKSGQRRKRLTQLLASPATVVLYESPFRVERLLKELVELDPTRHVVLARELTKLHEEFLRGNPVDLLQDWQKRPRKGEFVAIISGMTGAQTPTDVSDDMLVQTHLPSRERSDEPDED